MDNHRCNKLYTTSFIVHLKLRFVTGRLTNKHVLKCKLCLLIISMTTTKAAKVTANSNKNNIEQHTFSSFKLGCAPNENNS